MSPYQITLLLHVVGCLVLFMAIAVELVCLRRMRGADTTEQLREWASLTRTISKPLPIGTVTLVVSGVYLAVLRSWTPSVDWLSLSLASALVMGVVGGTVNSRRMDSIARAAEEAPPGRITPALSRKILDPVLLASVYALTGLTFGVVFLKMAKPDPIGAIASLVVAAAIGMVWARLSSRAAVARSEPTDGIPIATAR